MIKKAWIEGCGVPNDAYQAQPQGVVRGNSKFVMSRGELMTFRTCPHKWLMGGIEEESLPYLEHGSMVDCLWLTPNQWDKRFAVCPESYPDSKSGDPKPWNFNATFCKEWRDLQIGKTVVKSEKVQLAQNAVKFLEGNSMAKAIRDCSQTQMMVVGIFEDEATKIEVPIKALIDLVPDSKHPDFGKALADLKTTTCAAEGAWSRKVWEQHYDAQAALYLDLLVAATKEDRVDFIHVVQESSPPWEVAIWPLSSEFTELGRMKYLAALELYARCLKDGSWPGYNPSGMGRWIQPQQWMINNL